MNNYEKILTKNIEEMSDFLMLWALLFVTGKAPKDVNVWLRSEAND